MKILIAGDFVPQDRVANQINNSDYSCLNAVKPIIQSVDYAIVNFESPVVEHNAKPIDKTGPSLCCTEKAMECVAQAGFHCVTLANNHFRDYGQVGVEDTLQACKSRNLDFVGGGKNIAEAGQVLYKNINGQKLAIINCCENEWSIAAENYGGSNPLNPIKNYYAIKEAKSNADFVLVIVHGGIEGYQYPTPRMQETYRFFVDAGADAVVNHHQHCFSGYEVYHEKPIFYGLGNFCFDLKGKRGDIWNDGYIVTIQFADNHISYEIIPYLQCDEKSAVVLIESNKRKSFDEKISKINEAIANPDLLKNFFQKKIDSLYEYRILALEPTNKGIKKLQKKRLFPRLISREQMKSMLMRVRCESNSETLVGVLKKYFNL